MLEENGVSELIPYDAIVFWIFEVDGAFAFIRTSEGDNPPIHYFSVLGQNPDENGHYHKDPHFECNWCPTLDELCLSWVDAYIQLRNLTVL